MNIEGMITEIMVGGIGIVYALEKIVPRVRARRNGANNKRPGMVDMMSFCDERHGNLKDDISEIKEDIKELLRRNGGPRQ